MYHPITDSDFNEVMKHLPDQSSDRALYDVLHSHKHLPFLGVSLIDKRENTIISKNWGVDMGTSLRMESNRLIAEKKPWTDDDTVSDEEFDLMQNILVQGLDPLRVQRIALEQILRKPNCPEVFQPDRVRSSLVVFVRPKTKALPVSVHSVSSFLHSA